MASTCLLTYETPALSISQLAPVFSALRALKIREIRAKVGCGDREIIDMISCNLEVRARDGESRAMRVLMVGKEGLSEEVRGKKHRKTIDFVNNQVCRIFINEYRGELRALGNEFEIYMIWQGSKVRVYSQLGICSIFESRIMEMKHRLKWLVAHDAQLYRNLRYSDYIRQLFQSRLVKFLYLKDTGVLLHSSVLDYHEIKQVRDQYNYNATILQFSDPRLSRLSNKVYFKLLMRYCLPFLARISKDYEILTQTCWKQLAVVLHTPDPVFSEEPRLRIQEFLSKLVYIAYPTPRASKHLAYIRSKVPQSQCLQVMVAREHICTCWDTSRQIDADSIARVFAPMLQQLNKHTSIRVGYRMGGLHCSSTARLGELVEGHGLFVDAPERPDASEEIANVRFKSFINLEAKIKQVTNFLQQLLLGPATQSPQCPPMVQETLLDPLNGNSPGMLAAGDAQANGEADANEVAVDERLQGLDQKLQALRITSTPRIEVDSFSYEYECPQYRDGQAWKVSRGKRSHGVEQVLFDKWGIVCKVWSLAIQSPNGAAEPIKAGTPCQMSVVQEYPMEQGAMGRKSPPLRIQDLLDNHTYYMAASVGDPPLTVITHAMLMYRDS